LLCSERLPKPFIYGGTGTNSESTDMPDFPPERFEGGTPNIAGISGLREGIKYVLANRETILLRERERCAQIKKGFSALPGIKVYASPNKSETAGLFSFTVEGEDCEDFASALAEKDIAVRAGLHCAPLAHKSAGTLNTGTIRVSPCVFTAEWECSAFINVVSKILGAQKNKN